MISAQRLLILLVVWLSCCAGSAWFGWDYRDGKVAKEKLKAGEALQKQVDQAQGRNDSLELQLAALRTAQAPKDKQITKEVTRYVQVTPPAQRCSLPGTWRVRHDDAATGIPPAADAGPLAAGTDAPVEDAAALETVADNYADARACGIKLDGWIRYYRSLESAQ